MFRNQSADVHQFAMIPRADIPRSGFRIQKTYKTTFDSGYLVPIFCEEVLPGDTYNCRMTAFARLATPLFPIMDNCYLESFFFFVPNRLVWTNWKKFMGEQANPADSISFTLPTITNNGGCAVNSLADYFGIPVTGGANPVTWQSLPFRAYNLIWNEWFRDQNLQNSVVNNVGNGPDAYSDYVLLRRGKRHDYFTSALPFLQKGTAVTLPLGTSAPVLPATTSSAPIFATDGLSGVNPAGNRTIRSTTGNTPVTLNANAVLTQDLYWVTPGLIADLSAATAATINQLRQSFQIQKLLERDARGGTRYTEIVRAHFGVVSPDARLQRPEYLGGGSTPVAINPISQTSATGLTGGSTPVGTLAAMGTALAHGHGFTQSFTEHGYVIGLINVRADLTYQQGLRRHWSRSTRYDFYFPAFAMLGEQAILTKEIHCLGNATDDVVFGYQERWAEYRYNPSQITGLFRSGVAGTIDPWHLAQNFSVQPSLNATFIQETPPFDRIIAVGAAANGKQFLLDAFFDMKVARPLPMYSVPGLIDHF